MFLLVKQKYKAQYNFNKIIIYLEIVVEKTMENVIAFSTFFLICS